MAEDLQDLLREREALDRRISVARMAQRRDLFSVQLGLWGVLRARREDLGMRQEDVAEICGVSRAQIANIEAGRGASLDVFLRFIYAVEADFVIVDRHG